MRRAWMAFLTDYGHRDGFAAVCHAVVAGIAPHVRVIDVTHDVPPQDIRHGAAVLAQTMPYLPPCVVVGVVDPGVGSRRRRIAVAAGDHVLVGPDNGLLTWAADAVGGVSEAVELTSRRYQLPSESTTFDGRDVFAPVAAHVAGGVPVAELGPAVSVDSIVRLPMPWVRTEPGVVETEAHVIDWFGNVALAGRAEDLAAASISLGDRVELVVGTGNPNGEGDEGDVGGKSRRNVLFGRTFTDVAPGELVVYVDATGHAALAVNQGSAAARLGLSSGDAITLHLRRQS